jgi:trehalose 6-phosphate synthase/phosphatase
MGVGDDKTDEDMFKVLPSDAYSIKVGQVQSHATFYINNQHHVLDVLHSLLIKDISYRQNIDH